MPQVLHKAEGKKYWWNGKRFILFLEMPTICQSCSYITSLSSLSSPPWSITSSILLMEAQRACPSSHSWNVAELGFESAFDWLQNPCLSRMSYCLASRTLGIWGVKEVVWEIYFDFWSKVCQCYFTASYIFLWEALECADTISQDTLS